MTEKTVQVSSTPLKTAAVGAEAHEGEPSDGSGRGGRFSRSTSTEKDLGKWDFVSMLNRCRTYRSSTDLGAPTSSDFPAGNTG